jgi:hypothetical protein
MTWRLLATPAPGPDWQRWLEAFDATLYHSAEWGQANESSVSRPLYFRWLDETGTCAGIAVGIERWSARPGGRLFRRLDFESYPVMQDDNPERVRAAIGSLVEFAGHEGYRALSVQSYGTRIRELDLSLEGLTPVHRLEFVIDLTRPSDQLWKGLSTHHRRKIKRAAANGLTFEETCTLDGLRHSRALQIRSRDRRVARGEWIPSGDDASYERLGMRLFASKVGRVWLATREGQVVSAAFIWIYRGRAFYAFGGSSDEGFALDAPAWLFWQGFDRCRGLGCVEFNFGGVSVAAQSPDAQSHGLYRFKQGFGGVERLCVSGHAEQLTSTLQAAVGGVKGLWRR